MTTEPDKTIDDLTNESAVSISVTPENPASEPLSKANQESLDRLYRIVRYWYDNLVWNNPDSPFPPEKRYQQRMKLGYEFCSGEICPHYFGSLEFVWAAKAALNCEKDFDKFREALELAAATRSKYSDEHYRKEAEGLDLLAKNARIVYDQIIPKAHADVIEENERKKCKN